MTLILPPRVLETTTTTGTGTLTLAGAVTGYQTFAAVGDGNTCYYFLEAVDGDGVPTGDWEEGLGTYTASGTTLARTAVYNSSNAGAAVDLAAGTKRVAVTRPSEGMLVVLQPGGTPGTDELQLSHDGSNGKIENLDGELHLIDGTQIFRVSNGGSYITESGAAKYFFGSTGLVLAASRQLYFSGLADVGTTGSVGLIRIDDGILALTDGSTGGGQLEFPQVADVGTPSTNSARIGAEDVSGTAEMIVADEAGTETQISPHAEDAPPGLYDGTHLEEVHRSLNTFTGTVEFVNMTRMAKLVEQLAAIALPALPAAKRRLHVVETIDAYNARTGRNKVKRTWAEVQDAHQARYDAERSAEQARHDEWAPKAAVYPGLLATWTAARDAYAAALAKFRTDTATWLVAPKATRGPAPVRPATFSDPRPQDPGPEPAVRPVRDIRKPVPSWLAARIAV